MPTTVFLNGAFHTPEDARLSALDAGLQHAVGLFETLTAGNNAAGPWAHRLPEHLDRLITSATELGLSRDLRRDAIADAMLLTVRRSELPHARVRLTITGGDMSALAQADDSETPPHSPTVLIVAQPATGYPDAMFERGVRAAIADTRANPLNPTESHKTLSYWWRLRELHHASARGAAEALVFQVTNHLAGGCVSNAFIVTNGELITPLARHDQGATLPSPVLPGITRAAVLELADELGIPAHKRMLTIDDALNADELFLTNASWGILPVVAVEGEPIGPGKPGEITRRLREALTHELTQAATPD